MAFRECSRHRAPMELGYLDWGQASRNPTLVPVYYCPVPECPNLRSCKWLPKIKERTLVTMSSSERLEKGLLNLRIISPALTAAAVQASMITNGGTDGHEE